MGIRGLNTKGLPDPGEGCTFRRIHTDNISEGNSGGCENDHKAPEHGVEKPIGQKTNDSGQRYKPRLQTVILSKKVEERR